MLVALYHTFDSPLDHATLWAWHRMLMRERPALAVSGGYRQHAEAMQVVSGSVPTRIVTDQRYGRDVARHPQHDDDLQHAAYWRTAESARKWRRAAISSGVVRLPDR